MNVFFIFIFLFISFFSINAEYEIGPNFGVLLPSGIVEIDQVLKGFGIHGAIPVDDNGHILIQLDYGRGNGATMVYLLTDLRLPKPQGDFSPYFCLGPHFAFSRGADAEVNNYQPHNRFLLGFNIGGGFLASVKDNASLDFMIRLNGNPGSVIYLGIGLNYLF